jgi:hypothetical protein
LSKLIKSKARVADHGEVFTPAWLVEEMLNLVSSESERIDSRFLEPACGSGNFLTVVLTKKLKSVEIKYRKSDFEMRHNALFALMCIYGIELLSDNAEECRQNLLEIYLNFLGVQKGDVWAKAAKNVLKTNILQGDALVLQDSNDEPLVFPEWGYLGAGKFQKRDFRYDALTQRSAVNETLFEMFQEDELFVPLKTYSPMTVYELAEL